MLMLLIFVRLWLKIAFYVTIDLHTNIKAE
jgi:hypothetical protein